MKYFKFLWLALTILTLVFSCTTTLPGIKGPVSVSPVPSFSSTTTPEVTPHEFRLLGKWEGMWSGTGTNAFFNLTEIKKGSVSGVYIGRTTEIMEAKISRVGNRIGFVWRNSQGLEAKFVLIEAPSKENDIIEGAGRVQTITMKRAN